MKKHILNFSVSAGLFILFVVFTILVEFVDTSTVIVTNTTIGLSSINKPVFDILGTSNTWNILSLVLFIVSGIIVCILAIIAIIEFTKHKSISAINKKILLLIGLYILTGLFYILFENVIINYRPLLDKGNIKASYPSSHTLLICVISLSTCYIVPDYIKKKPIKISVIAILIIISLLAPISRVFSGMHWLTDVIGSLILSVALVTTYYSTHKLLIEKKCNEKTPE